MSLRALYQASMRTAQGIKDQASAIKAIKDTAASSKARKLSRALDSKSAAGHQRAAEKTKQAEDSLRTVMYLSCWGPN